VGATLGATRLTVLQLPPILQRMPLTDAAVRSAKPKAKSYKLSDSHGLYLEVSPRGGKWWRYKFRIGPKGAKVERKLSLGVYPAVSLREAREGRDDARKQLRDGQDPSRVKAEQKRSQGRPDTDSFEAIAREWHTDTSKKQDWVKQHSDRVLRLLERDLFPWLGKRRLSEIEPSDIFAVLQRMDDRGAHDTLHRARAYCSNIFMFGISRGYTKADPAAPLVKAFARPKGGHHAAITNPHELAPVLRTMWGYQGGLVVRSALLLTPLLFVRPGELRKALWADIDLEAGQWSFTASKTAVEHIVPLARQSVEILRDLQPLTARSKYVFPSARSYDRPMSENGVLAALRSLGIPKEVTCGHGFRATARTMLVEHCGYKPSVIEKQLAHAVPDANGEAYNRVQYLKERNQMMQDWADYLDKLRANLDVIPIRAAAG